VLETLVLVIVRERTQGSERDSTIRVDVMLPAAPKVPVVDCLDCGAVKRGSRLGALQRGVSCYKRHGVEPDSFPIRKIETVRNKLTLKAFKNICRVNVTRRGVHSIDCERKKDRNACISILALQSTNQTSDHSQVIYSIQLQVIYSIKFHYHLICHMGI